LAPASDHGSPSLILPQSDKSADGKADFTTEAENIQHPSLKSLFVLVLRRGEKGGISVGGGGELEPDLAMTVRQGKVATVGAELDVQLDGECV
jgi:hypothetical protein